VQDRSSFHTIEKPGPLFKVARWSFDWSDPALVEWDYFNLKDFRPSGVQ